MARGEGASTELVASGSASAIVLPTVGPVGDSSQGLRTRDLEQLDEVLTIAERATGLRFATYLGDLGSDTNATALEILKALGDDAPYAVLVAVSPGQRVVEIVTGGEAARRVSDRAARLGVLAVVAACADGDLSGALVGAVRTLADQAGTLPERSSW